LLRADRNRSQAAQSRYGLAVRLAVCLVLAATTTVAAAPPEPSGAHPRMILDAEVKAAWKAQAKDERGPVVGAIALCQEARDTREHDGALYQGSEWARTLQACLVAWAATEKAEYAATSIKFFTALLDDLDKIGDKQGGDRAASRDSGYAIRNLGPYTALAYDWLHDAPGMTPALRLRARQRWAAWLGWYKKEGYRAREAGTNYQAGYLIAATLIAIAQGGEAAEEEGPKLWAYVADELWGKDMASALSTGGILDGGDWPEGWQYGPLSVAEYALAARIARRAGIKVDGVEPWLASLFRRHVYGLSPTDRVFPGGDTEDEQANISPNVLTLVAVALGDASADDKRWARGELSRLRLVDGNYFLYDALANIGDKPALAPRSTWPTWYVAGATGTIFARTRWDDQAVWFITECQHGLEVDHRHPNAGNFVLSRGKDDVIVDPSPYGSLSTLTTNAPTVASAHFPTDYIPSQASWSEKTRWNWATQTRSGVVAARCDYADQYKFQERKSDVPEAIRDIVMLPSTDGTDAAVIVVDRANTDSADRAMYLRFRVPGGLALDGDAATSTIGGTKLAIRSVSRTSGKPMIGRTNLKDCFKEGTPKGKCDAARFPVSDFRVEIAGPEPRAVHAILASGDKPSTAAPVSGDGWAGVRITGPRDAVVVWPTKPGASFHYRAAKGTHVILDGPETAGMATITAKRDDDACAVEVVAGGTMTAHPAIVALDDACAVTVDPASPNAASAIGTKPPAVGNGRSPRSGCCNAQSTPGSPIAMAAIVMAIVLRRRGLLSGRSRARAGS
jgi:hypothetical protein